MYCGAGMVVTGIKGKSGEYIDSLKLLCSDIDDVQAGLTDAITLNVGGGSGGFGFERRCPPGMAVQRIVGRSADAIDQLRLVCHEVGEPARSGFYTSTSNTVGSTTGFHDRQYCTGMGALVGFYGQSGALVDRLGGICEPLRPNTSGTLVRIGSQEHITTAYGGSGGPAFDDECPSGFALVGFNARHGTLVDRIQGICGRISKWKSGVTLVASDRQLLPARGGNGGNAVTRECPQGQFLAGFETWSDDNEPSGTLRGLRPMCRRLEPMN